MASTHKHRKPEKFVPSVTHPYTERELTLSSLAAQRHFDRLFERAQISAYQIIIMLPVFSDRQETAECEKILSGVLDASVAQMRELHEQCDSQLSDTGITSLVRYTDAVTRKVPIYTPHVGQFVGLVVSYDALMQKLDTLWFNRAFQRDQRDEAMRRANVMLSDIMREMASLQERVIAARERHREAGREAAAKKAAKARAKAAAAASKRAGNLEKKLATTEAIEQAPVSPDAESSEASVPAAADAEAAPDSVAEDAQDAPIEAPDPRRVLAFVDDVGAPRVVDTVDGEFSGEHLDEHSPLDEAEAAVDAVHASLDAAEAEDAATSTSRARKTPVRKRATASSKPLAVAAG